MSMLFRRTSIIPVWLVAFGLFALSGSPMTLGTALVVLLVGAAVPLIIGLVVWKETRAALVAVRQVAAQAGSDRPVSWSAMERTSPRMPNTLTADQRWARWQEKGARRDDRAVKNMHLIAIVALTIGIVWASGSLL